MFGKDWHFQNIVGRQMDEPSVNQTPAKAGWEKSLDKCTIEKAFSEVLCSSVGGEIFLSSNITDANAAFKLTFFRCLNVV